MIKLSKSFIQLQIHQAIIKTIKYLEDVNCYSIHSVKVFKLNGSVKCLQICKQRTITSKFTSKLQCHMLNEHEC